MKHLIEIVQVEVEWGATIKEISEEAVSLSRERNIIVEFEFSGVNFHCRPFHSVQDLIDFYNLHKG